MKNQTVIPEKSYFYTLELLIHEVTIDENVPDDTFPQSMEQLKIGAAFGYVLNTEIELKDVRGFLKPEITEKSFKPGVGRSILFANKPKNLLNLLAKYPLEMYLKSTINNEVLASVFVPWEEFFIETVKMGETEANHVYLPTVVDATYELVNDDMKVVDLSVSIKLISYGTTFHTQFLKVPRENLIEGLSSNKYFFKSMNTETVFKSQVYIVPHKEEKICKCNEKKKPKAEDLTKKQLENILCKHGNCLAAKEFERFGIGAPGSCPRTEGLHEVVISQGLCHVFADLKNYGPKSMFLRPRTMDHEFLGKDCEKFSSPEYIQAVTDYVMRKRDKDLPCTCICDCGLPREGGVPQPRVICWDLLQSYNALINNYRCMVGLPLLEPEDPSVCDNPDCIIKSLSTSPDFRSCRLFLEDSDGLDLSVSGGNTCCPYSGMPPCQSLFYPPPCSLSCATPCSPLPHNPAPCRDLYQQSSSCIFEHP